VTCHVEKYKDFLKWTTYIGGKYKYFLEMVNFHGRLAQVKNTKIFQNDLIVMGYLSRKLKNKDFSK
jgi:hypothetical protein